MTHNHPGVIAPPPLLYAAAFIVALILQRLWPLALPAPAVQRAAGAVVLLAGVLINVWGARSMIRARTPINPYRPVTSIVSSGAFAFTRNPLYVGIDLAFIGLSLLLVNPWGLMLLVPVLVVMHYGVILREERHLEARFGEAYRQYRARVRRYL